MEKNLNVELFIIPKERRSSVDEANSPCSWKVIYVIVEERIEYDAVKTNNIGVM